MTLLIEIVSLSLALCLSAISIIGDVRFGIIRNRVLLVFALGATVLGVINYGFLNREQVTAYLCNVVLAAVVSLLMFYTHSLAGGDCKLLFVLSLLYPARFYLSLNGGKITLFMTIGFSLLAGYIYLLTRSVVDIVAGKNKLTFGHIRSSLVSFVKSYVSAMVYIALLDCVFLFLGKHGIQMSVWVLRALCMILAWCVGKYPIFRKLSLLIPAVISCTVLSLAVHTIPVSYDPWNYILVLILLLCQITIRTDLYETIRIDQLQKGMILSSISSMLMQCSITRGLPSISTEDLRSRLTSSEIESIKLWAKATRTKEITIVKKIPFAIFIAVGFIVYFILWCVL